LIAVARGNAMPNDASTRFSDEAFLGIVGR